MVSCVVRGKITFLSPTHIEITPLRGGAVRGKRPGGTWKLYQLVYFTLTEDWELAYVWHELPEIDRPKPTVVQEVVKGNNEDMESDPHPEMDEHSIEGIIEDDLDVLFDEEYFD